MDDIAGELFMYIGPDGRVVVAEWGADASGEYSPTVALAQHQTRVYASHSRSVSKGCTHVMPYLPYRTPSLMCFPRPDADQKAPLLAIIKKHAMRCYPADKDKLSYEITTTCVHTGLCKRCVQLRFYRDACDIYEARVVEMYNI